MKDTCASVFVISKTDYEVLKELAERERKNDFKEPRGPHPSHENLENAGFIEIRDMFVDNIRYSRYLLTFKGHVALAAYRGL